MVPIRLSVDAPNSPTHHLHSRMTDAGSGTTAKQPPDIASLKASTFFQQSTDAQPFPSPFSPYLLTKKALSAKVAEKALR